jgi:hypothetical protein
MRLHDWPERLSKTIAAARGTPGGWGTHDCCTFGADCILAVTGVDVAADWRGKYDSERAGLKLAGVRTLPELAARFFQEVHPVFAHRGDVGVAPVGELRRGEKALMLVVFDGAFVRGPTGLQYPRNLATRAWRVE